jgi:membrane fusion protein, multidrug efflux system
LKLKAPLKTSPLTRQYLRWLALPGLCLILPLAGCTRGPAETSKSTPQEQAIPVEVAPLARGPIEATLKSSWYLEAEQEVRVLARTSNRLKELLVEEGSEVRQNQVLARLEDHEQRTSLAKAENQLEKMQAEFTRLENLFQQKLVSEQAYTDMKFELRQLALSVEEARRQVDYTEIRAPISGTITKRMIKLGDLVANNQHLFDIVDFDSIVAYLSVPARHLPQLRVDQPARIRSTVFAGQVFDGYIRRISPVVEPRTGNVKVTIGLRDNQVLLPGMYVEVEIILTTKPDALLISKRSVVLDGEQLFVYRLKEGRRVERLALQPALMDSLNIEPAAGFAEGDQLVVAGQTGLKDGALIRLPGDPDPEKDEASEPKDGGPKAQQAETKPAKSSAS